MDQNPPATGKQLVETWVKVIKGEDVEKDFNQEILAVTPDNLEPAWLVLLHWHIILVENVF